MNDLLTVAEVAARLRFDESTVRRAIRDGRLRAFRPGGRWRVPADALGEFLAASAAPPRPRARLAHVPSAVTPSRGAEAYSFTPRRRRNTA